MGQLRSTLELWIGGKQRVIRFLVNANVAALNAQERQGLIHLAHSRDFGWHSGAAWHEQIVLLHLLQPWAEIETTQAGQWWVCEASLIASKTRESRHLVYVYGRPPGYCDSIPIYSSYRQLHARVFLRSALTLFKTEN